MTRTAGLVVAAVAACALATGCEKTVAIKLDLVEPCDQRQQALNGVQTFRVTSSSPTGDSVVFPASAPAPLRLELTLPDEEPAFVIVEGFQLDGSGNIEAEVNNTPPRSIGRTGPLPIAPETTNLDLNLLMGQVDSFGSATDRDGACRTMTATATGPKGRHGHTATYVPQANKVLIAGGAVWVSDGQGGFTEELLGTVELYDPTTGMFEALPDMPQTRAYHTATLLPDGRVFIAGGFSLLNGVPQASNVSTILWDARSPDEYRSGPSLDSARAHHTATLFPEANLVALIGGCSGDGCTFGGAAVAGGVPSTQLAEYVEVFDVAGNRMVDATTGAAAERRAMHAASLLSPNRVLVSGGVSSDGPVCTLEIYEVSGGSIIPLVVSGLSVEFQNNDCPLRHAQVTVSTEPLKVAIIGGQTQAPGGVALDDTGAPVGPGTALVRFFTSAGLEVLAPGATPQTLAAPRSGHHAALLPNGEVLVVGGTTPEGVPAAERMTIAAGTSTAIQRSVLAIPLGDTRDRAAMVQLSNGEVMFTGGYTTATPPATVDDVSIYFPAAPLRIEATTP